MIRIVQMLARLNFQVSLVPEWFVYLTAVSVGTWSGLLDGLWHSHSLVSEAMALPSKILMFDGCCRGKPWVCHRVHNSTLNTANHHRFRPWSILGGDEPTQAVLVPVETMRSCASSMAWTEFTAGMWCMFNRSCLGTRRSVELKHGRIAMLATMGLLATHMDCHGDWDVGSVVKFNIA